MTRLLAMHGMKRRWIDATLREGLIRDSAAWFVLPPVADDIEFDRTLAAATFLALAPAVRSRLAALTNPGSYAEFFATAEELMPAVLLFAYEPTGREEWHRYVWTGPPQPGVTFPYTKVARAARRVGFTDGRLRVVEVVPALLAEAEMIADETPAPVGGPTELTKLRADQPEPAICPEAADGKLTRVCAAIAAGLRVRAAPHIRRMVGHDPADACL